MTDFDVARQVAGVLIVFCLLGALVFLLGRRGRAHPWNIGRPRRAASGMEVVDRLHLTPQHSLHVVRVGGRGLLISSHPGGCSLLESGPIEQFAARSGAER